MSGRTLRLVCTAAVAAQAALVPATATAEPWPAAPGQPSTAALLTGFQSLYRQSEQATAVYGATAERLERQRAETDRLAAALGRARQDLAAGRAAAGRLARQEYQGTSDFSPYLRLLLARDPQHALEQGHVIGQMARQRAEAVARLTAGERTADRLARAARTAYDARLALARRQQRDRDAVREKLRALEKLLASLSPAQLTALAAAEQNGTDRTRTALLASGALGAARPPTPEGEAAVRYAVRQLGKPYRWGATGPAAYDCSGLTSRAWGQAGTPIPRTSQEQWARLPHVPLAQLRPGDLVVYFPRATHVALYLGDGMVVQAPRPGTKVKVSPLTANPVLGAVRPDPGGRPLPRYAPPALPPGAAAGADTAPPKL